MTTVKVKNGNVDGALKAWKQKVAKSGTLSEIKNRKHYDKPGVKRRKEKEENIKNAKKNARKSERRNRD